MENIEQACGGLAAQESEGIAAAQAFMNEVSTLRPVAARLSIPLPTACRLVNRMIAVGVLEVVGTVERPGRAMKLYRSSSGAFFVPRSVERRELPDEVIRRLVEMRIDEQVRSMIDAAREALGESGAMRWGTVIYTDRNGQLVVRPDFAEGYTPKLLEENTPAYLNFYLDDLCAFIPADRQAVAARNCRPDQAPQGE